MGALWVIKIPLFLQVENYDSERDCADASQTDLNLCGMCLPVNVFTLCWVPAWSCNVSIFMIFIAALKTKLASRL